MSRMAQREASRSWSPTPSHFSHFFLHLSSSSRCRRTNSGPTSNSSPTSHSSLTSLTRPGSLESPELSSRSGMSEDILIVVQGVEAVHRIRDLGLGIRLRAQLEPAHILWVKYHAPNDLNTFCMAYVCNQGRSRCGNFFVAHHVRRYRCCRWGRCGYVERVQDGFIALPTVRVGVVKHALKMLRSLVLVHVRYKMRLQLGRVPLLFRPYGSLWQSGVEIVPRRQLGDTRRGERRQWA